MKKTGKYDTATHVYSKSGANIGVITGGQRPCLLADCGGTRVGVRWEDGRVSFPCAKGMKFRLDGQLQIQ